MAGKPPPRNQQYGELMQAVDAAPRVSLCPYASGATSVEVAPFCRRAILAYGRGVDVL